MTDLIVKRRHLTALRYCARGSREFFERHGWNWSRFLRDGIPAAQLRATGDAMALKCVAVAEAEARDGR